MALDTRRRLPFPSDKAQSAHLAVENAERSRENRASGPSSPARGSGRSLYRPAGALHAEGHRFPGVATPGQTPPAHSGLPHGLDSPAICEGRCHDPIGTVAIIRSSRPSLARGWRLGGGGGRARPWVEPTPRIARRQTRPRGPVLRNRNNPIYVNTLSPRGVYTVAT